MTVTPLRRACQIVSCPNSGRYPVTVWVGGQEVRYFLCHVHLAEHRECGAA
jgi:hypothetical protein